MGAGINEGMSDVQATLFAAFAEQPRIEVNSAPHEE